MQRSSDVLCRIIKVSQKKLLRRRVSQILLYFWLLRVLFFRQNCQFPLIEEPAEKTQSFFITESPNRTGSLFSSCSVIEAPRTARSIVSRRNFASSTYFLSPKQLFRNRISFSFLLCIGTWPFRLLCIPNSVRHLRCLQLSEEY